MRCVSERRQTLESVRGGVNRRHTSQKLLGPSRSQEQNEATGPDPEDSLGQHQASGTLNLRVMLSRRAEAEVPWSGRNQEQREARCSAHQMMQVVYRQPIV